MPKKYQTPFTKTLFEKTIDDVLVPEDLSQYIRLGSKVARYKFQDANYDHIFDDSVDEHTKRMIIYAEQLPLSEELKSALVRTLWIHDIPEIIDSQTSQSDITSIDKIRYPELALASKEREEAIMNEIFSKEDKRLYHAFEPAKEMLFTGNIDFDRVTPVGMLARILDNFVDGINSFHGFVTAYLQSEEYKGTLPLPQRDSFEYCFQRGIDVYRHVSQLEHPDYQEAREIILDILCGDFFGYVDTVWTPLALARLPSYAREEHARFALEMGSILKRK